MKRCRAALYHAENNTHASDVIMSLSWRRRVNRRRRHSPPSRRRIIATWRKAADAAIMILPRAGWLNTTRLHQYRRAIRALKITAAAMTNEAGQWLDAAMFLAPSIITILYRRQQRDNKLALPCHREQCISPAVAAMRYRCISEAIEPDGRLLPMAPRQYFRRCDIREINRERSHHGRAARRSLPCCARQWFKASRVASAAITTRRIIRPTKPFCALSSHADIVCQTREFVAPDDTSLRMICIAWRYC